MAFLINYLFFYLTGHIKKYLTSIGYGIKADEIRERKILS